MDMSLLKKLEKLSTDPNFQSKWQAIKLTNKRKLAEWVYHNCKISIN